MSAAQRKRTWALAALTLGVATIAVPVFQRLFGRPRTRFIYDTGTLSPEAAAKLTQLPGWSRDSLEVEPGVALNGLVRRPQDKSAPWIFFLTGNDHTPLISAQRFLEAVRGDNDIGAAVYAYRGYDSSQGTPYRDEIAADMLHAYEALLTKEKLSGSRVHVAAFSLGAYFAADLAGETAKGANKPASVSLLAPAEFIVMVRRSWSSKFAPGDLIEMQPLLPAVQSPVLVVQGADDTTTGVDQGQTVAKVLGERARYVELKGVGHSELLENADAAETVRAFIQAQAK